jgi:phosphoribosylaminoimidazole carboxylase PurE protein
MSSAEVAIVIGSRRDWDIMKSAAQTLRELGVSYEARVLSAHRTPAELAQFVRQAEAAGTKVFIAAAGMAAHLAGAVASQTVLPVIGVPLCCGELHGLDALFSMVQMPPGVPVGTVAVGQAGAINAALLAVAILGLQRPELLEALRERRREQAESILSEKLD